MSEYSLTMYSLYALSLKISKTALDEDNQLLYFINAFRHLKGIESVLLFL